MKNINKGFTLVELLIVIAVLSVMVAALIVTINPFEQIKKSQDSNAKNAAIEFMDANVRYYSTHNHMPWSASTACLTEIGSGNVLSNTPTCISELVDNGELKQGFTNSETLLSKIHVRSCGDTPILCFNPQSLSGQNSSEAIYDQNGNIDTKCLSSSTSKANCYWCTTQSSCPVDNPGGTIGGTGTIPNSTPSGTITPTPTQTPSIINTIIQTLFPSPTPTQAPVQTYVLDDPKFLRTYIVLTYNQPSIPGPWQVDVSLRPDFSGTVAAHLYNPYLYYLPDTADTILNAAYVGDGNMGTLTSPSNTALRKLTSKGIGFISQPYLWKSYLNSCGKTIYWRLVSFYDHSKTSNTLSNVIDCNTKVGILDQSGWYTTDLNGDGLKDWTDYNIGALNSKIRAGGWQPPE